MMATKYYVRNFPLHKEIMGRNGKKSRQIYQQGDPVELNESEFPKYQHLVETEEQLNSRQKESKTKSTSNR